MKRERSVLLNTCMHLMVSEDFGCAVHCGLHSSGRKPTYGLRYGQPHVFGNGNEAA